MKYHLGIDGNEANVAHRVGSNQYAYGIITAIHDYHPENTRFTVYLKTEPLPDMPPASDWWQYRVLKPTFAWTQWRLPLDLYLSPDQPQVFYSPGHYAPRISPIPTVVSVMDLAFLKMPQLFLRYKRGAKQLADWTAYSVRQAKAVIAISEHTKKDVIDLYGIHPSKIQVAYPGIDTHHFHPQAEASVKAVKKKYSLPDKYVLHLGTLQPRKNIVRLIQAFDRLPPKFNSWSLVLAGQSGWLTEEIERAIAKSKKHDRIIRTGYVADQDVPALLAGASCLMMIGLYEGFGMPPAESLACGTIPVVSESTSLPEAVGKGGIIVDPYSLTSIVHGIIVALELKPLERARRLELGRQQIQQFSWTRSARIILKVLYDLTL